MAKVLNPTTLSAHFGLDPNTLNRIGVLDPTLAIDTKLFIDPLLFNQSSHSEISKTAVQQYHDHFEQVIKFLAATQGPRDVAWRTAKRLLEFHEIRGTCLGYGAISISGSGFGPYLTDRLLRVGKEIVDLGITDPNLFQAMALFEADIGPDRISDMATNVVLGALADFNARVLDELEVAGEQFYVNGKEYRFLSNPFQSRRTPIILVPTDILRVLPIAQDWDDVASAASKNAALRARVNEHIGHIWAAKTKRDKEKLRREVMASTDAFQALLDVIHNVPLRPYNLESDPEGHVAWAHVAQRFTQNYPLQLVIPKPITKVEDVHGVVIQIVERFRHLIEYRGLNKELYKENRQPRHESTAQRLFFAVAYCYCEANNVDISPEIDTGSGQVDFKISTGFHSRVLVEIKLSTNPKLVPGYERQLETYKSAEQSMHAIYLVIDVGRMGNKTERLQRLRNATIQDGQPASDIEFIDGILRPPASKR